MNGVIYARYSEGPKQTDQSIEGQVTDCMAFAKRNNINIIEIYADKHISGKSVEGRDEFQRMMQDSDKHKFECVIVWKVDRFGRNRQDIAFNKYRLKKNNVKLMYAAESIPDSPEGILLESIMEGLAEYYSADLSQKVKRGIRESALKGRIPGGTVPLGYKRDKDNHCVADPYVAPLITEAFKLYSEGAKLDDMVDFFNERGVSGLKGSKISRAVLHRVFRNEAYLGTYMVQDIAIPIPQLVDKETFDLVQNRNKKMTNQNARKPEIYLLSCKMYCGKCGALMVGESGTSKNGKTHRYYKCGAKKRHTAECDAINYNAKMIEDAVIKATSESVLNDEMIEFICDKIEELQIEQHKNSPIEQLQKRLYELNKKINNLVDAIAETGNASLSTKLTILEAEKEEVVNSITKAEIDDPVLPRELFRAWLYDFKNGDTTDTKFCINLVETFIHKVIVTDSELQIFYNIKDLCSDKVSLMDISPLYSNTSLNIPIVLGNYIYLRTMLS